MSAHQAPSISSQLGRHPWQHASRTAWPSSPAACPASAQASPRGWRPRARASACGTTMPPRSPGRRAAQGHRRCHRRRSRATRRRRHRRRARPHRHPDRLRRHHRTQRLGVGLSDRRLGSRDRRQPQRRVLLQPRRRAAHAAPRLRPHRQHRLDRRQGRQPQRRRLFRVQGRRHRPYQVTRQGTGEDQRPRQLRHPRRGAHAALRRR